MTRRNLTLLITVTVLVHAVVVLWHAWAHLTLDVNMTGLQNGFIGVVIIATPILAGVLVWTRFHRAGVFMLAVSMLGALVFGAYHHFLKPGIDHISGVPTDGWGSLFRLSTILLAIIESWGSLVGWWEIRLLLHEKLRV